MVTPSRSYQSQSAEARVAARRRRLVDTAFELMSKDGWRVVTIERVCSRAKLNKRYFYESFADLDALADAVVDELAAELLATGLEAARSAQGDGLSTDDLAKHVMRTVIGWLIDDRRRARVLFSEIGDNPQAQLHRKAAIRQMASSLSAFSYEFHGAEEPYPIAQVGAALLIGGSIEALVEWLDGEIDIPVEELVDDLAGFWVAVGTSAVELQKDRIEKFKGRKSPKRAKSAPKSARKRKR